MSRNTKCAVIVFFICCKVECSEHAHKATHYDLFKACIMFSTLVRTSSKAASVISKRSFFGPSSKDPIKDAFAAELKKIQALKKAGKSEKTADHDRLASAVASLSKMEGVEATGAKLK
eukprot:CFRG7514T1